VAGVNVAGPDEGWRDEIAAWAELLPWLRNPVADANTATAATATIATTHPVGMKVLGANGLDKAILL
jgi:hypothetical protein